MIPIVQDPISIFLVSEGSVHLPPWRSHPGKGYIVGAYTAAVDAEWDRPFPRISHQLLFTAHENPRLVPFWAWWTAKEALYKRSGCNRRCVPADFPVIGWQETLPSSMEIQHFFVWDGGFSACINLPNLPNLWVSAAFLFLS